MSVHEEELKGGTVYRVRFRSPEGVHRNITFASREEAEKFDLELQTVRRRARETARMERARAEAAKVLKEAKSAAGRGGRF